MLNSRREKRFKPYNSFQALFSLAALAILPSLDGGELRKALDEFTAQAVASDDGFSEDVVWLRESEAGGYRVPAMGARETLIVLDTSPSMRDPSTTVLRSSVIRRLEVMLQAMMRARRILVFDSNGRFIGRWPGKGGVSSDPADRGDLEALVRIVASYRNNSESRCDEGLLAAVKAIRHAPASIFVVGDEYGGRIDNAIALIEELDVLLKSRDATVSFVKAHDFIIDAGWPRSGMDALPFDRLSSPKRFNSVAAFLSNRYGGKLYVFQARPRAPDIRTGEELILLKLMELRPGEQWAVDAALIDVTLLNELVEQQGKPRLLAARGSEESAGRRLLELEVEKISEGVAFCYVTVRDPSGEEVAQYRALMQQTSRHWRISEWLTVLETASEG